MTAVVSGEPGSRHPYRRRLPRPGVVGPAGDQPGAGWALAGLPGALPEGSSSLGHALTPTRQAGSRMGSPPMPYPYRVKKSAATALVWPGRRSGRVERLARAGVPRRDLANTPAGTQSAELAAEAVRVAKAAVRSIRSLSAKICSPRISRPSMPSVEPRRGHRASSISSGAIRPHRVTLVSKVCFDTGGST